MGAVVGVRIRPQNRPFIFERVERVLVIEIRDW